MYDLRGGEDMFAKEVTLEGFYRVTRFKVLGIVIYTKTERKGMY